MMRDKKWGPGQVVCFLNIKEAAREMKKETAAQAEKHVVRRRVSEAVGNHRRAVGRDLRSGQQIMALRLNVVFCSEAVSLYKPEAPASVFLATHSLALRACIESQPRMTFRVEISLLSSTAPSPDVRSRRSGSVDFLNSEHECPDQSRAHNKQSRQDLPG